MADTPTISILFLDDDKRRRRGFEAAIRKIREAMREHAVNAEIELSMVVDAESAITLLGLDHQIISLDHDLADIHYRDLRAGEPGEKTGMDVVRWLRDNPTRRVATHVNVHSWNPYGAQAMFDELDAMEPWSVSMERFPGQNWLLAALREHGITLG